MVPLTSGSGGLSLDSIAGSLQAALLDERVHLLRVMPAWR